MISRHLSPVSWRGLFTGAGAERDEVGFGRTATALRWRRFTTGRDGLDLVRSLCPEDAIRGQQPAEGRELAVGGLPPHCQLPRITWSYIAKVQPEKRKGGSGSVFRPSCSSRWGKRKTDPPTPAYQSPITMGEVSSMAGEEATNVYKYNWRCQI